MEAKIKTVLTNHLGDVPIQSILIDDQTALIVLEVTPDTVGSVEEKRPIIQKEISKIKGIKDVQIILTAHKSSGDPDLSLTPKMVRPPVHENLKPAGIRHIICVASGKGGVGKSTVAANLAMALKEQGLSVGLMDADIYGPSVPTMFDLKNYKAQMQDGELAPAERFGLKLMSIGFLVDSDTPMIWRGPMIQSAIRQFLQDVNWGSLDVLVVDMPPGTGDAQLTMAQKVPLSGAVIVSTPQDIALIDAKKGIEMFKKTNVPIFGLVENMSYYECENCGHHEHIFGDSGARNLAEEIGIPFIGSVPLHKDIRISSDAGRFDQLYYYHNIAKEIGAQLMRLDKVA